jgi:manganese transport protein
VPLILITRRKDLMGNYVNHPATTAVAGLVAVMIIGLNAFLLYQTFFG